MHIHRIDRNKSPLKISGKSSRARSQELPKMFMAPLYWAHRAVIFAIAQLSCSATNSWATCTYSLKAINKHKQIYSYTTVACE